MENRVHALVDGELDAANSRLVEVHLSDCAKCRMRFEELKTLSESFKALDLSYSAPPSLRAACISPSPFSISGRWSAKWVTPTISFALGALLVWIVPQLNGRSAEDAIQREVISGHIRSLMADHLSDVISTDQHTVKPWFMGKLDFSPPVADFSAKGFALIGGRLDYLDKRAVSALVYQRNKHRINVFIWPATETSNSSPQWESKQGYHLAHWRFQGMNYWAISDLNSKELGELVSLLIDH
jgi:anti-sigma factor RsiW